ncbi:YqgE/AlgH family protein [Elizabethkingia sp. JS20170427COW]|uniref:YqgE/AlgH family protein n=1 Tax=Elizabethkingia sp. JS20170427COW TaxID=2583851 RepID=UPI0011104876|nr:YqgE/AlgH family protein [Elizabethkingia sp. JS20170427COW]QCX54487.1 YqgE/AlgH family protein [Elizabethkingia sp. JS20170427COW]
MTNDYKGKILISAPDASGDIFSRSVVLIIEHNEKGSFGLILNKKNPELSGSFKRIFGFETNVYEGGPISHDMVFFIVKGKKITSSFTDIDKEYYMTDDIDSILEAVFEKKFPIENVKIFAGYSGWSAHQLEEEVEHKLWKVVSYEGIDYTQHNDANLWKNLMKDLGGENLIWANSPEDIHQN